MSGTLAREDDGPEDRRHRRRQHLHPGARPGPRRPHDDACRSTSSRSTTSMPSGSRSSPGCRERILRRNGWPGRLTTTTDRDAAIDGAGVRPRPAPDRGPGRPVHRRDAAPPVRLHRPGDDRAGRVRQGASDRARGPGRWPRTSTGGARPTPGSSTSRTRSGSSPRRCSMPATGRSGCATWRSGSSAGWRPASA